MRISVVVPARNEEAYLEWTLAALAAQTRAPDEVIVVDNGSTDGTARLAVARGARLVSCPTPGVAHARQAGLEAATGDWVMTTDADSRPVPGWLGALEAAARPGVVAVYGPLVLLEVHALERAWSRAAYRAFLAGMAAVGRPNLAGSNMGFQREAALAVGGYPRVEAGEDLQLGRALRRRGELRYVPEACVHTSARRLRRGRLRFLWKQVKNLAGDSRGYFDE